MTRSRAVSLALCIIVACLAILGMTAELAKPAFAIEGGVIPDTSQNTSAVALITMQKKEWRWGKIGKTVVAGGTCTGTLVSPTMVLTAQHCTNIDSKQGDPYPPGQISVDFAGDVSREVIDIHRIDGYDENSGVRDLALLQLGKPVTSIYPVAVLDGAPSNVTPTVARYGFGRTTPNEQPDRRLRVSTEGLWSWEDRVDGLVTGDCAQISPKWSEYGALFTRDIGSGHSMHGDSGGPVVVEGAIWALAGVTSGTLNSVTCSVDGRDAASNEVGVSNRVDTKSGSFFWSQSASGATTQYRHSAGAKMGPMRWPGPLCSISRVS